VIFASAPSAAVPSWFFNGLARTIETAARPLPSASLATVRRAASAKPLAELTFNDDADGADGCAPAFSGVAEMVMWIVRVRARPSRPKPISMPTLRRKVAARRSLPASARGVPKMGAGETGRLITLRLKRGRALVHSQNGVMEYRPQVHSPPMLVALMIGAHNLVSARAFAASALRTG
jgi:hypothetical protein